MLNSKPECQKHLFESEIIVKLLIIGQAKTTYFKSQSTPWVPKYKVIHATERSIIIYQQCGFKEAMFLVWKVLELLPMREQALGIHKLLMIITEVT